MRPRIVRRAGLAVVSIAALLCTAAPPAAAGGPGAHHGDGRLHGRIVQMLRHMTLEEKVGQLFVVEVYGQDAETVTPAMAARNQALYGVDTPAQAICRGSRTLSGPRRASK